MRRRSGDVGLRLLVLCAVMSMIAGCSFFNDECDETANGIDALARTYSGNDPEKVYAECRNALTKCPKIVSAYKLMGTIDMADKNYEAAIANYSKALELNPEDPETLSALRSLSVYSVILTGNKIEISGKKITKQPFNIFDISLKEYSQIDQDVRLSWLRSTLDAVSVKMAEENKKQNPNNVFSGSMSAFAEEVDQDILAQAEANPNEKFGAAYKESSVKAVTMHTNVRLTSDGNWETELR